MEKIKIKIGKIGHIPFKINFDLIKNWKSDIFEITDVEEYYLNANSDSNDWSYSDDNLNNLLPNRIEEDFFVGITYIPLEDNYYSRRLESNRVVLTYIEMYSILKTNNIPLENLIIRLLYAYSIVFLRENRTIPDSNTWFGTAHDETKGCLFDMNGLKTDVIFSLNSPILCNICETNSINQNVSKSQVQTIHKEIKKIKKSRFYRIVDFIKERPIISILLSIIFSLIISIVGSYIYDNLKHLN